MSDDEIGRSNDRKDESDGVSGEVAPGSTEPARAPAAKAPAVDEPKVDRREADAPVETIGEDASGSGEPKKSRPPAPTGTAEDGKPGGETTSPTGAKAVGHEVAGPNLGDADEPESGVAPPDTAAQGAAAGGVTAGAGRPAAALSAGEAAAEAAASEAAATRAAAAAEATAADTATPAPRPELDYRPTPGPGPQAARPSAPVIMPNGQPHPYPRALIHLTVPNLLTAVRCASVILIVVLLIWPWGPLINGALVVFALAALTDWFDGKLARAWNATSDLGRMLDHVADKLLIGVTMLALCAIGVIDGLNVLAAALILAREIAISGLREHLGARKVVVPATMLAKWKTTFQMVALAALMAAPLAPIEIVARVTALLILWIAMGMTLVSGFQYVWGTRHVWNEE